jgi:hypothetical protein
VDQFKDFFTTYNRTLSQKRVRDLTTLCAIVRGFGRGKVTPVNVVLCGDGRAGLWALLAAPAADAVVADCAGMDTTDDQAFLAPDIFCPSLRAMGGFETGAILAAPNPLLLHNTGQAFTTDQIGRSYRALRSAKKLRVDTSPLDQDALLNWLARL